MKIWPIISILLALSTLAGAQTVIQDGSESSTRYSDGSHSTYSSRSTTIIRDYDEERREAREAAREMAEQQATENARIAQAKADAQQRLREAIATQNAMHDHHAPEIDDDGKLISYIKAHGYTEVTPVMIDKLRGYMSAHGLLHVEELDK